MNMMKKAIVTGITGQDGAYLARFLLSKGYKVYGTYRRLSSSNFWRIQELGIDADTNFELVEYDLTDLSSSIRLLEKCQPNEVYNLAAQSFVGISFDQPLTTASITGLGPVHLLEAIRLVDKKIKYYQASTSEMFGKVQEIPQTEKTPFYPRSPYGVAKLYAHWMTINYSESYDIFGSCGILFNHESPLRGLEFVTRKITHTVAMIKNRKSDCLYLGNLNAKRDWGFAGDYVEGMWKILQYKSPEVFVLGTNKTTTVREFVQKAFLNAGIEIEFSGKKENEVGIDRRTGKTIVKVDPKYYRPAEVDLLIGDYSKANQMLHWSPKVMLNELVEMMVSKDMERVRTQSIVF